MPGPVLGVGELNRFMKGLLDSEEALRDIWVRGEISSFNHHTSGHMYFTLKDDRSAIKCVMFRSNARLVRFKPHSGLGVLARGSVSVYERDGQYQLYVVDLQPEGAGALHLALVQLKKQLGDEGLFDPGHKKPLPFLPRRVGVVTSATGAAIRDIIEVSGRRLSGRELVLAPAQVQGQGAARDIARALSLLDRSGLVDVIIVGRGGGSLEDLWAFNEEAVARAIFACQTPVVSAVGHETDFTIADLVADLRAPTPSAAAELVVPRRTDLLASIRTHQARLGQGALGALERVRSRISRLSEAAAIRRPVDLLRDRRQAVDSHNARLVGAYQALLTRSRHRFTLATRRLDDLSPLSVLGRGYSICRQPDGAVVRRFDEVRPGTPVEVVLARGKLACRVTEAWDAERGGSRL